MPSLPDPTVHPGSPADDIRAPEVGPDHVDADIAAVARIGAVPTILKVISEVTGLRLALVSRVTQGSWTACAVLDRMDFGLAVGDHLEVATTLCSEVRDRHEPIIIEHASQDPAFCMHPTPKLYGFESYIAVPIMRANGDYFGNVCAMDFAPMALHAPKTLAMMQLFAELISLQLTEEEESVRDREALSDERQTAELREQFIAVLGHDLRSPLSAILAGSGFLLGLPQDAMQRTVLERIGSSGERMTRLVDDIMDFARGRLGGGMPLTRELVPVAELVENIVAEISSAHPERLVRVAASDAGTAWLDPVRIAQMLSNLVANAVEHGSPGEPVDVVVESNNALLRFAVISRGHPIPPHVLALLFQPYFRAVENRPRTGLGLGLYIAAEIARAHGGHISAESTAEGITTFTVDVPQLRSPDDVQRT